MFVRKLSFDKSLFFNGGNSTEDARRFAEVDEIPWRDVAFRVICSRAIVMN